MTKEIIIKRLSIIKYLYNLGLQQSKLSESTSFSSVLNFHDAIDMFMQLAAEKRGISKISKGKLFLMDFFQEIPELTQSASVEKINTRRNNLKHHGLLPAKVEIEESRIVARLFLEENTKIIFNIDFDSISLLNLVAYDNIRALLQSAEELRSEKNTESALISVSKAFYELLHIDDDFKAKKKFRFLNEKLTRVGGLGTGGISHAFKGLGKGNNAERIAESFDRHLKNDIIAFNKNFEKIEESLNIVFLGIDYRRYRKFKALTPWVSKLADQWIILHKTNLEEITEDDVQFTIDFVIESSLELQEVDLN